jgi:hypothetical protein
VAVAIVVATHIDAGDDKMDLKGYLGNVGKNKNPQTGDELFSANIRLTKKDADQMDLPRLSLIIKDTDENRLTDLLAKGQIVIKIINN